MYGFKEEKTRGGVTRLRWKGNIWGRQVVMEIGEGVAGGRDTAWMGPRTIKGRGMHHIIGIGRIQNSPPQH